MSLSLIGGHLRGYKFDGRSGLREVAGRDLVIEPDCERVRIDAFWLLYFRVINFFLLYDAFIVLSSQLGTLQQAQRIMYKQKRILVLSHHLTEDS